MYIFAVSTSTDAEQTFSKCNQLLARLILFRKSCACLHFFTVRRYALHGLSYRNSVRLSVRSSVCHTRALCTHGSTYYHDLFTTW